jgi:hypothetical protein
VRSFRAHICREGIDDPKLDIASLMMRENSTAAYKNLVDELTVALQ